MALDTGPHVYECCLFVVDTHVSVGLWPPAEGKKRNSSELGRQSSLVLFLHVGIVLTGFQLLHLLRKSTYSKVDVASFMGEYTG